MQYGIYFSLSQATIWKRVLENIHNEEFKIIDEGNGWLYTLKMVNIPSDFNKQDYGGEIEQK